MRFQAGLTLADSDGATSLPIGVAVAFAAAVAVVGLVGRRRVPAGLGEGALVGGVSGGALLLAVDSGGRLVQPALGHVLTGLAILWYVVSQIIAGWGGFGAKRDESADEDESARERRQVLAYAALVCGLAALVNNFATWGGSGAAGGWAAAADLAALLVISVVAWVRHRGSGVAYPTIALLVCLLVLVFPADRLETLATACVLGMNVAGVLSLVVIVGTVLVGWWHRRRRWLKDPECWAEPAPPGKALCALLVGVSLLVGVGGVLLRQEAFTPTAVLLAGATCLTIGHVRTWRVASEVGLILVAESIVTASLAWIWPGWSGGLFGAGLAGVYLLWLARFWEQQLNQGVAWTTTGRLIPRTRHLAYVVAAGAFALAVGGCTTTGFQTQPVWFAVFTTLLLLGGMSLLVRDGYEHGQRGAAFAACLMATAAAGPASRVVSELLGSSVSLAVLIAAAGALLALRVGLTARLPTGAAVYNAYVGGILPVAVLLTLSWRGLDAQGGIGVVLTAVAVVVRFTRFRPTARVTEAKRTGRV